MLQKWKTKDIRNSGNKGNKINAEKGQINKRKRENLNKNRIEQKSQQRERK